MEEVAKKGYVAGFAAVRISKTGRRFTIEDVTLWNVVDDAGNLRGQAAIYVAQPPLKQNDVIRPLFERTYPAT